MANSFPNGYPASAIGCFAVTPSNDTDLSAPVRAVTIGTAAGTISFIGLDGETYTSGPLPIGRHDVNARRIRATGTTATGLTGWI